MISKIQEEAIKFTEKKILNVCRAYKHNKLTWQIQKIEEIRVYTITMTESTWFNKKGSLVQV